MFGRLNESFGVIIEALKSRGILTGDDQKAFSHATHADDLKIFQYVAQARSDYLKCAVLSGVALPDV